MEGNLSRLGYVEKADGIQRRTTNIFRHEWGFSVTDAVAVRSFECSGAQVRTKPTSWALNNNAKILDQIDGKILFLFPSLSCLVSAIANVRTVETSNFELPILIRVYKRERRDAKIEAQGYV